MRQTAKILAEEFGLDFSSSWWTASTVIGVTSWHEYTSYNNQLTNKPTTTTRNTTPYNSSKAGQGYQHTLVNTKDKLLIRARGVVNKSLQPSRWTGPLPCPNTSPPPMTWSLYKTNMTLADDIHTDPLSLLYHSPGPVIKSYVSPSPHPYSALNHVAQAYYARTLICKVF